MKMVKKHKKQLRILRIFYKLYIGVSPSRNSPATTQTPPPPRGDTSNKERPASHNNLERELQSIATPAIPPIPTLESDNPSTSKYSVIVMHLLFE